MYYTDIVDHVAIYGIDDAVRASKYPMLTSTEDVDVTVTKTTRSLAQAPKGSGHDSFLKGIIVQFDLRFTNKAWVEAERYHFFDIVSSESTMHKMAKFNLDESYIEYVDPQIVSIMKKKVNAYNAYAYRVEQFKQKEVDPSSSEYLTREEDIKKREDVRKRLYLELLYSNPAGFRITAKITTNYQQLKTIYSQRKNHTLPEWRSFCEWIETLPYSEFITGKDVVS